MRSLSKFVLVVLFAALPLALSAQTGKRKTTKKPAAKPKVAATPQPTPEATPELPLKKNERESDGKANSRGVSSGGTAASTPLTYKPVYVYTFERPGFTYSSIKIEHDEDGKGRIWFKKDNFDEPLDDPIELSKATLEKLKEAFAALNFIDSTEDYQYPKDFSNMGNVTITLKGDGRSRTVKYNWTDNKNAKLLMDTYRAISNEYTWKFEFTLARENQPLLTPGLIDALDSYLSRNEMPDPPHLLPFLDGLSNDERLPLIARNRVRKIIERVEKAKK